MLVASARAQVDELTRQLAEQKTAKNFACGPDATGSGCGFKLFSIRRVYS
jgi:hypothetical protein